MRSIRLRRAGTALIAASAIALGAAACGGDEQDAGRPVESTRPPATSGGGEGSAGAETGAATQVTGGTTTLRLDERVRRVLDVAGVEVGVAGEARTRGERLVFPIRQGELDIDTPSGRIQHDGALRFAARGREVEATDLVLDVGDGTPTGAVAGRRVPLLAVEPGTARVPQTGDVVVARASVTTLTGEAAGALGDRLGVDVLGGGLRLGDVTVRAQRP